MEVLHIKTDPENFVKFVKYIFNKFLIILYSNCDIVEVDVEVVASGRRDSRGQGESISCCRIVMTIMYNNTVFLSDCIAETCR